jgi:thiamine biosynthesis lipoprotein
MPPRLEIDRRTLRLIAIAFVLLASLTVHRLFFAETPPAPDVLILDGRTMGTTYEIRISGNGLDEALRGRVEKETADRLGQVDLWMSNWNPASEISRFNAHRGTDPVAVSRETAEIVAYSLELNEISDGAFDITVGPLVARWGFGNGARVDGPPSPEEIEAIRRHVGSHFLHVERDDEKGVYTLRKDDPLVEIDLSAIAKGYGVDHVAAGLEELGRHDYLVEIGGEVRATGQRPGGGPWRLAVEKPQDEGRSIETIVELSDRGMATSGDYRIFYLDGDRRVSHTIDPRTGRPPENGPASVSIVTDNTTEADAWATTLMVLGEDKGLPLADSKRIGALLMMREPDGTIRERRNAYFPEPAPRD